jgi:hypothetical protein
MTHDLMCPMSVKPLRRGMTWCQCALIARVREDERSNIDREMAFAHKVGYDRGRADIRDEGRNTG